MQTYFPHPQALSILAVSREEVFAYLYKIETIAALMPHIDLDAALHGSFVAGTEYRR